ncbi:hypothetical protein [Epilithonimonas hominis]|nr:hypothetical protein [Epilithonimonas hominis]
MKKIFFYIFGLFIITSCSPNQDINGDFLLGVSYSSNGGTNATIKNIKTVTTVDDAGDKIVATYNYTGVQLTSVTSSDNSFSYQLTYTGDDITKILYKSVDDTGKEITNTQVLTYSAGKLTKSEGDVVFSGSGTFTSSTIYSYDGDKIKSIITKVKDKATSSERYTIQTDYGFSGSNVSNFKYSLTYAAGPITQAPIILNITLSNYDSYKNPFGTLPMAFKLVSAQFDLENNALYGFSKNNYKTTNIKTNTDNTTVNFSYSYDTDGYPILGTSSAGKVSYEYVK